MNACPSKHSIAKPFIKWAGGKRAILGDLLRRIPEEFNAYFEPFLGGGALFWNIDSAHDAYLSDINFHLIITYTAIRDNVQALITWLERHKREHSKEYYAQARMRIAETTDPMEVASLFIYLNKTCYNGLYRVNKSGFFNVPMGRYKEPAILDVANLHQCSQFLAGAQIVQYSFTQIDPQKDDFIYFDPPYHTTFSSYDSSGFEDLEHKKLADFCTQLDKKGVFFMLSNSDTPFIRELYKKFYIETIDVSRYISCKGNERKKANELIIRNYIRRDEGK